MSQRVPYYEIAPHGMKIMMEMEKYTKTTDIDRKVRELIKFGLLKLMVVRIVLICILLMPEKWEKQNNGYIVLVLGESAHFTQMQKK